MRTVEDRLHALSTTPAAVRLGRVDTATFRDWRHPHTGGIGALNGPVLPDMLLVMLATRPPPTTGTQAGPCL